MPPMRIAIDARKVDDFGIGSYLEGLIEALIRAGEVRSLVLLGKPSLAGRFTSGTVEVETVPFTPPLYSFREMAQARRAVESSGADLFHEPHYTLPRVDVPSVVTIHDLIHLHRRGFRTLHQRLYARNVMRKATRRASRIVCVSRTVADELRLRYPKAAAKIEVVPNGVDRRFRGATDEEADHRRLGELGVSAGDYLVSVGNDKPHKNLDRLVEAFALLRRSRPRTTLLLIGAAPQRFRGMDGVILAGRVSFEVLRAAYRNASAAVQVSLEEGFGLPVVEAMACSTPVIAADIPIFRETTAGAASLVDPLLVEKIAEAMLRLCSDRGAARELGERGRERSLRYDWDEAARSMLAIYDAARGRA